MNSFVNALNSNPFAVGDIVKLKPGVKGWNKYSSWIVGEQVKVTELGVSPGSKPTFRGYKMRNGVPQTSWSTSFVLCENFEIVQKGEPAVQKIDNVLPVDEINVLIVEVPSLKVVKACNEKNIKDEVSKILRNDMNKKLRIFKQSASVSVGELPIQWDYNV